VFDGLRGIAILAVVWYHLALVTGVTPTSLIAQTGFMGVDLFFFVSGFCLFWPHARHIFEGRAAPTLGEFAERRLEKILPSYFVALAVIAAAHASWFPTTAALLWNVVVHALFIHPWWWATFGSISGPFWTLGIEVQFYALFPLFVGAFRRRPILVFLAMTAVAHLYRAWVASLGADNALYATNQLPAVFDVFGAGMLAAYAIGSLATRDMTRLRLTASTVGAVVAFGSLIVLLSDLRDALVAGGSAAQYAWLNAHRVLFALDFFALASCIFGAVPAVKYAFANPFLMFAAAISYNVYLWHLEIIVWLAQLHVAPLFAALCAVFVGWAATVAIERPLLKGGWRRVFVDPVKSVVQRLVRAGRAPAIGYQQPT
jgi:peptidoglycan/LPS O-acetylase OafA/YrhL